MSKTMIFIEVILTDYIKETGKRPLGIALGPSEYKAVCAFMQNELPKEARIKDGLISEAYGIPIFLKELPGIDLLIPHAKVDQYLGKIKNPRVSF